MEIGEIVSYIESGKTYAATVLEVRVLAFHLGSSGEPLVHLGFFKPQPGLIGTQDQNNLVQFRYDVVHSSHKFDKVANKAGFTGVYPGGRWSERNGTH